MKENEVIVKRQAVQTRFKNQDMDFTFNWFVGISQLFGLSASQIFYAVKDIRDGNASDWRKGFVAMAVAQLRCVPEDNPVLAGEAYLSAAYAYRAALQYTSPRVPEFATWVQAMETAFQKGVTLLNVPIRAIEVPFEGKLLAGYYLEHDATPRPLLLMVGASDTFREDLFPFAGYPGWKRGYNVLMVDSPPRATRRHVVCTSVPTWQSQSRRCSIGWTITQ